MPIPSPILKHEKKKFLRELAYYSNQYDIFILNDSRNSTFGRFLYITKTCVAAFYNII